MRGKAARAAALLAALLAFAFPVGVRGAECEGDECQGPPPAPEEVIPGTAVVEGPPNPPLRFPQPKHKKKHRHRHSKRARQGGGR